LLAVVAAGADGLKLNFGGVAEALVAGGATEAGGVNEKGIGFMPPLNGFAGASDGFDSLGVSAGSADLAAAPKENPAKAVGFLSAAGAGADGVAVSPDPNRLVLGGFVLDDVGLFGMDGLSLLRAKPEDSLVDLEVATSFCLDSISVAGLGAVAGVPIMLNGFIGLFVVSCEVVEVTEPNVLAALPKLGAAREDD